MTVLSIENKLLNDFGLRAVVASEIEFYLFGSHEKDISAFWGDVRTACANAEIPIFNIEKERGHEQHEVSLKPCTPEKTANDTAILKNIIIKYAAQHNMRADFSAKPLADDFGSGLHIHVHLENEAGENQFFKNDSVISDVLNYSLGGLLAWLPDTMPIFAPSEESYKRFVAGSNGPMTISWGANNRTTALRLPDSDKNNKRIEHRVAGADADAAKVIAVILASIHHGIKNKTLPDKQIYGDARLESYNLALLPNNLELARNKMLGSNLPFAEYSILMEC